jgi:hypothetical protein
MPPQADADGEDPGLLDQAKQAAQDHGLADGGFSALQGLVGTLGLVAGAMAAPAAGWTGPLYAAGMTYSLDLALAGWQGLVTGEPQATRTNGLLRNMGLSDPQAGWAEMVIGMITPLAPLSGMARRTALAHADAPTLKPAVPGEAQDGIAALWRAQGVRPEDLHRLEGRPSTADWNALYQHLFKPIPRGREGHAAGYLGHAGTPTYLAPELAHSDEARRLIDAVYNDLRVHSHAFLQRVVGDEAFVVSGVLGKPAGVKFSADGAWLDAEAFLKVLKDAGYKGDRPIYLNTCLTGKAREGQQNLAQTLADRTGQRVFAYDTNLRQTPLGPMLGSPAELASRPMAVGGQGTVQSFLHKNDWQYGLATNQDVREASLRVFEPGARQGLPVKNLADDSALAHNLQKYEQLLNGKLPDLSDSLRQRFGIHENVKYYMRPHPAAQ